MFNKVRKAMQQALFVHPAQKQAIELFDKDEESRLIYQACIDADPNFHKQTPPHQIWFFNIIAERPHLWKATPPQPETVEQPQPSTKQVIDLQAHFRKIKEEQRKRMARIPKEIVCITVQDGGVISDDDSEEEEEDEMPSWDIMPKVGAKRRVPSEPLPAPKPKREYIMID